MRKPFPFSIDDEIDAALTPKCNILGDVPSGFAKAERLEQLRKFFRFSLISGKFYKLYSFHSHTIRHIECCYVQCRLFAPDLVHQIHQRPAAIDGDGHWRTATELIVEDFERQISTIAGCRHSAHKVLHRQIAFTWHIAKMTAPVEQIHVDQRRIGKLHDKNLVTWDGAN